MRKILSFEEYSTLSLYPTLKSSCSKIGIKYREFLEIKIVYNELCGSDLVADEWINYLFILYEQSWDVSSITDFRRIGALQFQTLRSICSLVQNTINDALETFYLTEFVQSKLVFQYSFQLQINTLTTEFIRLLSKTILRKLHFIQNITAQSLFMTGASVISVRPVLAYQPFLEYSTPFPGINYTFTDGSTCICSSSTSTDCLGPTSFQNEIIPGFQTGCYTVSALLQSTLEAFLNQTFIDILTNSSHIFRQLNSSIFSSTIETLLSQLFILQWLNQTSY
ncbi:unnamed protein product [Adineta ricciae]|uniref:Uncharacterized protein n=1 Tax=Adineta ricciae TaxID=249248 RepID=A0A815JD45_ADIRI|nr:unnamed protein product [Adineta ricciae]CAF1375137.1 unnamed protein product [Adineta ricciae]